MFRFIMGTHNKLREGLKCQPGLNLARVEISLVHGLKENWYKYCDGAFTITNEYRHTVLTCELIALLLDVEIPSSRPR